MTWTRLQAGALRRGAGPLSFPLGLGNQAPFPQCMTRSPISTIQEGREFSQESRFFIRPGLTEDRKGLWSLPGSSEACSEIPKYGMKVKGGINVLSLSYETVV